MVDGRPLLVNLFVDERVGEDRLLQRRSLRWQRMALANARRVERRGS
jgi:hypothetical protein